MHMNLEEIKQVIPHRNPILLISEVLSLTEGESIEALFYVDPHMDIFRGHFPEDPVFPGIYTTECMAQASDILLLSTPRYRGTVPLFLGMDKVRFLKKILPGDTVTIRSLLTYERPEKAIATCSAQVLLAGERAATGEITVAMR